VLPGRLDRANDAFIDLALKSGCVAMDDWGIVSGNPRLERPLSIYDFDPRHFAQSVKRWADGTSGVVFGVLPDV
jgi:hypothetical protein